MLNAVISILFIRSSGKFMMKMTAARDLNWIPDNHAIDLAAAGRDDVDPLDVLNTLYSSRIKMMDRRTTASAPQPTSL